MVLQKVTGVDAFVIGLAVMGSIMMAAAKARQMARLTLKLADEDVGLEIYYRTLEGSPKRLNIGVLCLEPREIGRDPFLNMHYPHIDQVR